MDNPDPHKTLSVACFNEVWNLLSKASRSPEEDRLMREMAHASLFHWLKRSDCHPENISIGLWQVSRVHAVLGNGTYAHQYAGECIDISHDLSPFHQAYSYEAAARAAMALGLNDEQREYVGKARALCGELSDEDRALLESDLRELTS